MALCPRDYSFLYSDPILKFGEHYDNIFKIKDLLNDIIAVKRILSHQHNLIENFDIMIYFDHQLYLAFRVATVTYYYPLRSLNQHGKNIVNYVVRCYEIILLNYRN